MEIEDKVYRIEKQEVKEYTVTHKNKRGYRVINSEKNREFVIYWKEVNEWFNSPKEALNDYILQLNSEINEIKIKYGQEKQRLEVSKNIIATKQNILKKMKQKIEG